MHPFWRARECFSKPRGYHLLKGRHAQIGQLYSVTAMTEQRNPIFRDVHLGRLVVDQLRNQDQAGPTHSLAWAVMPNPIHGLFELQARSLGVVMCQLTSRSSLSLNQTPHSHGRVWQKGYHERAVRQDEDLKTIVRYITFNPVRAGLARRVGEYPLWDAVWL
ncbi:transposase [Pseudomonas sp. MF4836]|nr:transposase [Pseudomonas sp. MF4836]